MLDQQATSQPGQNYQEPTQFNRLQSKIESLSTKYKTHEKIQDILKSCDLQVTSQNIKMDKVSKEQVQQSKILNKNVQFVFEENKVFLDVKQNTIDRQVMLAQELIKKQKIEDAKSVLYQLIQNKQENSDVYFLLGSIYFKKESFKKSEACFLKCFKFEYYCDKVFLFLSLIYLEQNSWELAKEFIGKYKNNDDEGLFQFAKKLFQKGKQRDALNYIDQCILMNPKKKFYLLRIDIYKMLGRFEEAQQDLQKIITLL